MKKDRKIIEDIISEMLDNPDSSGIYPTTKAYHALESLVEDRLVEAIGWTHADDCVDLDRGNDPRKKNIPEMLSRAIKDLTNENDD